MGKRIGGIVILAGGTAKRLGGVSKPDLDIAGRRLIDIVFDQLDAIGFTGQRIVVAPADVDVPRGVQLTLEDPPHG
ncbi:MAG: NTP transferase domain-containing protein, partial [Trueperella sp.]|nr:NTP transferase domain-containing protein [Trueperella sp.]